MLKYIKFALASFLIAF